jgi:hypothetical protein
MTTLQRIFLLLMLLCTLQVKAQYVTIITPTGFLAPVCPMDINGVSDSVQVTMLPSATWGPASGNATFELVNVYNTAQVYSSVVAPTFPGGNDTVTVTFKLPKLNASCDDTLMMQARVTIPGATPATIYSSAAFGVRYLYTSSTSMNSNPPYQDLIPYYIEHCPGDFPQPLGAGGGNQPAQFKWQLKVGSVWNNIFPGSGFTTSAIYNATANGTYRCVVHSPFCGVCFTVTSDFIVKDIDSLQIASFSPSGTSPQLYTPGMSLQRSAPGVSHTYTNYQWYRNGVPIPGATSNVYTPVKKGIYTLSGTGPCGQQMSNAFELFGYCDTPGYKMIIGPNLSGTYTGNKLMSGEYIVPSGSTAIFNTADVITAPCTRITVANGGMLVVRSSTLRSCRQWYGIVVNGKGTFAMEASAISDAYIAVTGNDDNAKIDIQSSTFRDNHLSIWSKKNRTRSVQNIHDNNLFTDIDLTNGYRQCDNIQSVATIIDPLHDHIFIDGSNEVNIVKNNTFKGFPMLVSSDLYPCPVIAVQANNSSTTLISTANKFNDMLLDGVLLNHCTKTRITDGNLFTAFAYFGNAICINASSDITIDNSNTVKNYAYGVKGNTGNRISVLGNSFTDNIFGISLTGLTSYKVDGNTISSKFTGMETYNDNFTTVTPPPHRISNNTFKSLYQGLIISPVKNPLYSTTTAGNILVAGPQNVQVLCNNFIANSIAITGSAPIVDQYYQGQQWAGNTFNQNTLWDIAWVDSVISPAMNYYHDVTLVPPNQYIPNNSFGGQLQPAFAMNGIPVTTAFVAVTPNSNGLGNCSYDSYSGVPKPTGVEGASSNSNEIQVYPNPVQDWLMIKATGGTVFGYNIINIAGQVLRTGNKGSHTQINVSELPSGTYFLKLVMANGKMNMYKFVKE